MSNVDDRRLVYSTEHGRICPECGNPENGCKCAEIQRSAVRGDGNVKVRREKSGRAGKTVTTISGVPLHRDGLRELQRELQKACGAGGALKEGVIEIQGDHCEFLIAELAKRGYRAKRSGG